MDVRPMQVRPMQETNSSNEVVGVVASDSTRLEGLGRQLAAAGYRPLLYGSTAIALRGLRFIVTAVDAVVILEGPDLDGVALAQALDARCVDAPRVVLIAEREMDPADRQLFAAVDSSAHELIATVARVLG